MQGLFAAIVVVTVFLGIPALMALFWDALNGTIWMWGLRRSIGPFPTEVVYVPRDVRNGWRPLGIIALLWFLVGMPLFLFAARGDFKNHLLTQATVLFCIPPIMILAAKVFSRVLKGDGVVARAEQAPRDRERRLAAVERLTALIPGARPPLLSYLRLWRAGHLAELLALPREQGRPTEFERDLAAEADVEDIRCSGSVNSRELERVEKVLSLVRSERAKARSNITPEARKKLPPMTAIEAKPSLGGWTVRLPDGTSLDLLISAQQVLLLKGSVTRVWQFEFPFAVSGAPPWDVSFEIRDLVLTSIGDCRTLAELHERLATRTTQLLRDLSAEIQFGPAPPAVPTERHRREEVDRASIRNARIITTPDTPPLLCPLDTVELPAVSRFVAAKSFTPDHRIDWMDATFKKVMLPLVEENVAPATLTMHRPSFDARDLTIARVAAALDVDEMGTVSLAHFFHLLSRLHGSEAAPLRTDGPPNVAYILSADGNIMAVSAYLGSGKWQVDAESVSDSTYGWNADTRFLARRLKTEEKVLTEKRTFPVFKTIALGTHRSIHKLMHAIQLGKFNIDFRTVGPVLEKVPVAKPKKHIELDLVAVSAIDLGFDTGPDHIRRDALYARALELGLRLCPAEVGPQLLLQGWDLPPGLNLLIAMEPLAGGLGDPFVFWMTRSTSAQKINVYGGKPESTAPYYFHWVFVQPRRTPSL